MEGVINYAMDSHYRMVNYNIITGIDCDWVLGHGKETGETSGLKEIGEDLFLRLKNSTSQYDGVDNNNMAFQKLMKAT